ncbi:hypothetical protein DVK85_03675 [Flavobacterium arcticum]|uniref:Uncharacterized protein n=1 Tax=Flavobacterium arcticum TaxID=1784713 RepID=A0A345H9W8_9FLAO|nr:hypothetical protein [Flavobacterium arcticum]AXG73378.1 hypothetical protein DVK85_03675 [Flavobacterium arcticum]KAF2513168.1 hypothetical protein E0W72_01725 [Flavobacterium arcticum]
MKFKGLLAFTALLATTFANAQQAQTYVDESGGMNYGYTKKAPSEPAGGTQYYIDSFNAAKIDDSNEITLVKYNAYSDEMELKIHDEVVVLEPKDGMMIRLVNNQANYTFTQYTNKDGIASQNYLVVISDASNLKIFKRERIYLQPEQHPQGGYQKYKAPLYKKQNPEYYIQMNNGDIVYMSDRKKDVIKLIPGKEKEVKKFMKENRIKISDDKDLQLLGNYMNTLL